MGAAPGTRAAVGARAIAAPDKTGVAEVTTGAEWIVGGRTEATRAGMGGDVGSTAAVIRAAAGIAATICSAGAGAGAGAGLTWRCCCCCCCCCGAGMGASEDDRTGSGRELAATVVAASDPAAALADATARGCEGVDTGTTALAETAVAVGETATALADATARGCEGVDMGATAGPGACESAARVRDPAGTDGTSLAAAWASIN